MKKVRFSESIEQKNLYFNKEKEHVKKMIAMTSGYDCNHSAISFR